MHMIYNTDIGCCVTKKHHQCTKTMSAQLIKAAEKRQKDEIMYRVNLIENCGFHILH